MCVRNIKFADLRTSHIVNFELKSACGAYKLKICAGGTRALTQSAIQNSKSEIQIDPKFNVPTSRGKTDSTCLQLLRRAPALC